MAKKTAFKSAKSKRTFPIVYTANWYKKPVDIDWIRQRELGGADALFLANIQKSEDGGITVHFNSIDGATGEPLNDQEKLKLWGLMAQELSKSKTLGEEAKKMTAQVWKVFADAVARTTGKGYVS